MIKTEIKYQFEKNKIKKEISDDEAINIIIKKKLLMMDAKSKGIVISEDKIRNSLDELRNRAGIHKRVL